MPHEKHVRIGAGKSPTCSIIVPVHNRSSLTRQLLDRLLTGPAEMTEFEVIVVDDASSDDTSDVLAARDDLIRIVAHETTSGFAKSCNAGAKVARGQYLVFLNNDTEPEPGWLDALVSYAHEAPHVAVVGSKLLYPNDTVQHAGIVVTQERIPRHIYAGFPANHPAVCKSRPFQMVTAACALVRRDAFEAIGGFDEAFLNGYEDIDLCLRLGECGAEVHLCSDSVLYHLEKATRDESSYSRNHEFFVRRWGPRLEPDDLRYYLEDGLLSLTYWEQYPLRLEVSPLLAEVAEDGRQSEADRLLAERARQVFELLQQNVQLSLGPLEDRVERAEKDTLSRHAAVLFLSGAPGDTKRYRCDHQAEELALLGATADVVMADEVPLGDVLDRYAAFVLHRVPWSEHVEWFLSQLRQRGKPAIFDTDDLVFDPDATRYVAALEDMDAREQALFRDGIVRFRRTMLASDVVVVTTESLRALADEVHPGVLVAPNGASIEMVELAEAARASREQSPKHDAVTLAYMSGTHTHNRDFLEAADAVLDMLAAKPNVRLLVVGHLKLDKRFDRFPDQVEQLPLQPWQRLAELLARVDINLAPLESENPFTESKSCLKYIEAGLVAVPTIASPRTDFVRAIRPGENGMLADSPDQWREALRILIEEPQRRTEIGRRAYEDVHERHTTKALAATYYERIATASRDRAAGASLTVNWISRAPIAQTGGGYQVLFRIARSLAESGHRVRMYIEPNDHLAGLSRSQIAAFVEEHFGPAPFEILVGHEEIGPADATIATNWPTAYTVASHDASLFRFYLIQDFEPDFYERADPRWEQAAQTYALPLRHVCMGHTLAEKISRYTGKPAEALEFGLNPAFTVKTDPANRRKPIRVLFFARPGVRRRGFELGIEALRLVKERRPDVEILCFGAAPGELGRHGIELRDLGVLDPLSLADAMNDSHILLSFSLTNISHVPFEAMACGCAVVEAAGPWLSGMVESESNCLLAEPDAEAVADAVLRLADDDDLRVRIARKAATDLQGHTWERTNRRFEDILLDACFARLEPEAIPSSNPLASGVHEAV